jgi:hypothetical protein
VDEWVLIVHISAIWSGAMTTSKTRIVFYADDKERDELERLHIKTGAPKAELIRRALKMYLEAVRKGKK